MTDRDPYAFTNGECADKLEEFLSVAKERDPVGWPRAILPYIERAVECLRDPPAPFRGFIADADRPLRKPNGRNDNGDLSLIRSATQPPAVGVDVSDEMVDEACDAWDKHLPDEPICHNGAMRAALHAALRTGGGAD